MEFIRKYKVAIFSGLLLLAMISRITYKNIFKPAKDAKSRSYNGKKGKGFVDGETMGTWYHIKFKGDTNVIGQQKIDSVLKVYNQSVSTYIDESEISTFNKKGSLRFQSGFFKNVLSKAQEIYKKSGGCFDPTVMPLVNAYGFGYEKQQLPDSSEVRNLLKRVGMDKISFNQDSVWGVNDSIQMQLDFSAIAKGYGTDVVSEYLLANGIKDFMVEIGGEVRCNGTNFKNQDWWIGIVDPLNLKSKKRTISLKNQSMATSGNYFNYYEKNGKTYSHTINPITGYPERNAMMSVTVLAKDCMTADAWATAFMVMGPNKGMALVPSLKEDGIEVFFIYLDEVDGEKDVRIFSTLSE